MSSARDLYIITTAKKRNSGEWWDELIPFNISSQRDASLGYVQVVVDSWNNITRYTDIKDAFFIFDEQRLVGSGAWVKAFYKIAKQNQWIILSATPGDTWSDYIPAFVANGYYRNRTEFLETHAVYSRYTKYPKIDRYINTGRLLKLRSELLIDMPYTRRTSRIEHDIICSYDTEKLKRVAEDRWNIFEEEPIENISQLFYIMRKVVNSDESRIKEIVKLHEKHPRLIIFYNFTYELEALRSMATRHDFHFAEYNGQKHEPTPVGEKWVYFVQYTAGAEAWNCITTDSIAFFSLNYSWKVVEQCKGRIDRLNTPFDKLHYYFLRSTAAIDQAIRRSLKTKKEFNEYQTALEWESPILTKFPVTKEP